MEGEGGGEAQGVADPKQKNKKQTKKLAKSIHLCKTIYRIAKC
jgi:hypothetical protein